MDEVSVDARNPWKVLVHRLGRQPGSYAQVQLHAAPPQRWGDAVLGCGPDTSVQVQLRCEAVGEGVLVSGEVSGQARGECIRCLDPLTVPVQVPVQELFTYEDTRSGRGARARARQEAAGAGEHDADEALPTVQEETIDLLPTVRDAVVLALPAQPLCRPDCRGLCPQCGQRLADSPDHAHEVIDPRWAALHSLNGRNLSAGSQ